MTTRTLLALAASVLLLGSARAADTGSDAAFYLNAANCAAALKARVEQHLQQPPTASRNQAIQRDTELGFTFVGLAYKRGLRNPQADHMLKAAESRWQGLSPAQQNTRVGQCTREGQQLLEQVAGLERYLVKNRAKARVGKLLSKEQVKATS